ncbi:hypothetical protein M427DRAFT_144130 [Gonapodya prolifera JEL478]|uniref:Uncharacterized protein n=1 Tax=Gonapodya prolifera (strain JEL478) TaxID=1344416 RepID=A0A139ALN5_GONPJ|nr:hypothetical protein M427DRAFT_144130 [Gonapodya prolifera JEL478]|eukprot:KXS17691.1 hypothetical protein M427DRAFT_144130 [Gonapodya prolifera JEL478]
MSGTFGTARRSLTKFQAKRIPRWAYKTLNEKLTVELPAPILLLAGDIGVPCSTNMHYEKFINRVSGLFEHIVLVAGNHDVQLYGEFVAALGVAVGTAILNDRRLVVLTHHVPSFELITPVYRDAFEALCHFYMKVSILATSIKVLRTSLVPLPGNINYIVSAASVNTLASIAINTCNGHMGYLGAMSDVNEMCALMSDFLSSTAKLLKRIHDGMQEIEKCAKSKEGDGEEENGEEEDGEEDMYEAETKASKQLRYDIHLFFDTVDSEECRNCSAKSAIGDTSQEVLASIAQYRRLVRVKQKLLTDDTLSCIRCGVEAGHSTAALPLSKILTYEECKEVNNPQMQFGYERLCYFRELLLKLQALEFVSIQQDVLDRILLQLKAERVTNLDILTKNHWKGIMQRAGLPKFYMHHKSIKYAIDGIAPPCIDSDLQLRLETMFMAYKNVFEKYKWLLETRHAKHQASINYLYTV